MTVFLSYAHQDAEVVNALRQNLEDMGHTVWIDETLYGGQMWWDEILLQIRQSHVFVLVVSRSSLASEACLAEASYATAVLRNFVPVRIDDVDMTAAPKLLRDTQHIEFKVNDAQSVIAIAKALNSVPAAVALPDPLPPAPQTPQSYRDRYAALLSTEPLSLDDQLNYFVRLTVDIDTANSEEALQLLRVLHDREDLSWKVRQRIDRFLAEGQVDVPAKPPAEKQEAGDDADEHDDGVADDADDEQTTPDPHDKRRLWWIIGAAAALVVVVVGLILLLKPDHKADAVQLPENDACDADSCGSTPIRFFLDFSDPPDQIKVSLTDPNDNDELRVDPPSQRVDGAGLEWTWNAQNYDPIGTYTVSFVNASGQTEENTFTISAIDGPFGLVQNTAAAISKQDWEAAAALDRRLADELDNEGPDFLATEYPPDVEKHWYPFDASGNDNDAATTIIGAYIAYSSSDDTTSVYCELWTVDLDRQSMRSSSIMQPNNKDKQVSGNQSGRHPAGDFGDYVESECVSAVHPS